MTRTTSRSTNAILTCCCYCATVLLLASNSNVVRVEARSWWSLEIPALDGIRDADPLYASSSALLMEDASFLYGSFSFESSDEDHVAYSPSTTMTSVGGGGGSNNPSQDAPRVDEDPLEASNHSTSAPSAHPAAAASLPIQSTSEPSAASQTEAPVVTAAPTTFASATSSPNNNFDSDPGAPPRVPRPLAANTPPAAPRPVQLVGPFPPLPPTASPTASPATSSPTVPRTGRPTPSPSARFEASNGGCPGGSELHRVWMYDSAGDGWGSTRLTVIESSSPSSGAGDGVVVFEGSLDAKKGAVRYASGEGGVASIHAKDRNSRRPVRGTRRHRRGRRRLGARTSAGNFAGSFSKPVGGGGGGGGGGDSEAVTGRSSSSFSFGSMADAFQSAIIAGSSGVGVELVNPHHSFGNDQGAIVDEDHSGDDESVYLCLSRENACYAATVSGGTFLEEVRWEITRVEAGTGENIGLVARGVGEGSGSCTFSLDDSCAKTCDGTPQAVLATSGPTAPVPSRAPTRSTRAPVATPTQSPSVFRSRKPATTPPSNILPQDREFAFGRDAYRRIRDVLLDASPSSEEALDDEDSPQSRALDWLYDGNASGLADRALIQRWVLASFYFGANGDEWIVKTGWMESGTDECRWYGVSCLAGIISKIELEQNRLRGEIVPEIAVWRHYLYVLSLGNDYGAPNEEKNEFVAPVPAFLGDLTYLSFLNLEGVGMTSTIPEALFSSWPHLESLYLNDNDITGSLPGSVKDLGSVEVLWLGGNNLGGPIATEIGLLSTLRDLSLESNFREDAPGRRGFSTTVPSEIGKLTSLEVLSLADNALSGQVPKLDDLISLRRLQLSGNFFEGQLPPAWGRLEMLEELDLSFNWLSSTIPADYGNMISLTSLSLQSNYNDNDGYFTWGIKGELPVELGKLKNLEHIDLSNNYLTGTLITEIGQLYLLQTLNLQNNFLQGPIPSEFSNSVKMKEILLQDNNIDGDSFGMPEEICRLPDLELARVDCEVPCNCCLTTC